MRTAQSGCVDQEVFKSNRIQGWFFKDSDLVGFTRTGRFFGRTGLSDFSIGSGLGFFNWIRTLVVSKDQVWFFLDLDQVFLLVLDVAGFFVDLDSFRCVNCYKCLKTSCVNELYSITGRNLLMNTPKAPFT